MRQIILASESDIYSYSKRNQDIIWSNELDGVISSIKIIDSNLLIAITTDKHIHCLKRDSGETVWTAKNPEELTARDALYTFSPLNVSVETDRRLNSSVLIIPNSDGLTLINPLSGETLTSYTSIDKIKFISDYDTIDKSFYLIEGDILKKIRLDVLS